MLQPWSTPDHQAPSVTHGVPKGRLRSLRTQLECLPVPGRAVMMHPWAPRTAYGSSPRAPAFGLRRLRRRRLIDPMRHVVIPLDQRPVLRRAVSDHSPIASQAGMVALAATPTHALGSINPPSTPSSHRGSRLVPTTVPYSLDWTANSIGAWDSRNPEVRDLSHSKTQIPTAWV